MNIATILVSGVHAHTCNPVIVPQGIVGASVTFDFEDPLWEGLSKTAVFQGDVIRDVIVKGNTAIIPAETAANEGTTLKVGVYGVDDKNNLAIPTLWATIGKIGSAADPSGDPGTEPDLPVWAQLADAVNKLKQTGSYGNGNKSNLLKGKKLSIIGDSISTFSGYIPDGYETWYPKNYVDTVEKTWWYQLLQNTGMVLCKNASWSGSTLCGNSANTNGIVGCSDARVEAASGEDEPDIIIVFIGINDFAKNNGYLCGEYDGSSGVTAETTLTSIADAYGLLLSKLRQRYPKAFICGCRIMPEKYSGGSMNASFSGGFPNINPDDSVSLPVLNEQIEKICKAFGCGVIPMDASGISFYNVADCTGDGLHPNEEQMRRMAQVAEKWLYQYVVDSTVSGDNGDSGDSGDGGDSGSTHSHSYTSAITKAATCETDGVRTYTCSCGNSYTEKIPATGHSYVDGVCSVCGSSDPDSPGVDEHWTPLVYTEIGGYYNHNGSLVSYNGVFNTDQVAVGNATKIKFTQTNTQNHYIVFWDDGKKVIHSEKTSTPETHIFDIPDGAAYFAIAYYEAEREKADIQVYVD